jgi:pyruvate/2-oxoglutarate dehydrogenase complex dihydrolipoamide dehydrogenase (E3) component
MTQEFDLVCLGGGVAGEAIAAGLHDSGLTLAMVERELVGGECAYWGCVPSKGPLRSGETLSEAGTTGLGGFTHLAHSHGQVIARRLRGMDARADHAAVPRVTYTDPEIASAQRSKNSPRRRRCNTRRLPDPLNSKPGGHNEHSNTA